MKTFKELSREYILSHKFMIVNPGYHDEVVFGWLYREFSDAYFFFMRDLQTLELYKFYLFSKDYRRLKVDRSLASYSPFFIESCSYVATSYYCDSGTALSLEELPSVVVNFGEDLLDSLYNIYPIKVETDGVLIRQDISQNLNSLYIKFKNADSPVSVLSVVWLDNNRFICVNSKTVTSDDLPLFHTISDFSYDEINKNYLIWFNNGTEEEHRVAIDLNCNLSLLYNYKSISCGNLWTDSEFFMKHKEQFKSLGLD